MATDRNKIISLNKVSIGDPILHWHDELELLVVTDGSLELKVGYEILHLSQGDIMLINCDEIHSTRNLNGPAHTISVFIDCNVCYDRFPDLYEIIALWPYKHAFEQLNSHRGLIIRKLYEIALSLKHENDNAKFLACFDALIKSFIYCYRIDLLTVNELDSDVDSNKMDVIYRTIKYIYSNFDHKVNLQEISEQEYMNLFHLSHSFKEITGYSFRDWLNFVRAEHAEKMLLQTSYPLSEIAYRCGFSDVRYLNKHFLKWYNLSPNKYRDIFKPSYEMVDEYIQYREDVPTDNILTELEHLDVLSDFRGIGASVEKSISIDISADTSSAALDEGWKDRLYASISWLLQNRNTSRIQDIQSDIGFNNIIIDDMFSIGMNYVNASSAEDVYETITSLINIFRSVAISVNYNDNYIYEIDAAMDFIEDFAEKHDMQNYRNLYFEIFIPEHYVASDSVYLNDFIAFLNSRNIPHLIQKYTDTSGRTHGNDYIDSMITEEMDIEWMFYKNGFRNNVYYFQTFLSRLYDEVVEKDDSYIITRKDSDYKILYFDRAAAELGAASEDLRITFLNMPGNYKYAHYEWNIAEDDTSSLIRDPKVVSYLDEEEYQTLYALSIPMATFDIIRPSEESRQCSIRISESKPASGIHLLDFSLLQD